MPSGTRIGPYEILSAIAAGGMGVVYRAHDTKLNRDVAIKVLLPEVANDPDRLARFSREAQVLASLNHPNIAHIHGLEESSGATALVMELVEGPTLADLIGGTAPRALDIDDALRIARQIADALEAAHDQGIIHRDLKPANVKVRQDGSVKVLDFGLAKAIDPGASPSNLSMSPTITSPAMMTGAGVILGTAAYMSPEQARGKTVDRRSDIWAFGCVLYEMLSGTRAFAGEDVTETLAAIIRGDPDWTALPVNTPAPVRKLLHRCLEKDRKRRLDSAADARLEIEEALSAPAADALTAPPKKSTRGMLGWVAAAVFFLATLALAVPAALRLRETPPPLSSVRFQIPPPGTSAVETFALSPDGRHLAFIANTGGVNQLWLRDMETLAPRALADTDGATFPFWSPDGAYLGFFAQGKLKKISAAGGPPQTLCDASDGRGGTWNREGIIVFSASPGSPILRVSAAGGVPIAVPLPEEAGAVSGHRFPVFLPDGKHFFYTAGSDKADLGGVFVASLDGTAAARLLPDQTNALYAPSSSPGGPGYLVFRREETLMAQAFDPETLKTAGEMFPIADQVPNSARIIGHGAFSVSASVLTYRTGGPAANREMVWMDRSGKRLGVVGKPAAYAPLAKVALSPDETTTAVMIPTATSQTDVWLYDLKRNLSTRFTFRAGINRNPVWSPGSDRIAFAIQNATSYSTEIRQKALSGNGNEELLIRAGINGVPLDWSADGKWILYQQAGQDTALDLWLLPLEGDRKPVQYVQTPFTESDGVFSPDSRWVAYQSNESRQDQIYVQPVPPTGAKYQISAAGGTLPRWRHDGKELFYLSPDHKVMAVPIALGARLDAGTPLELFGNSGLTAFTPSRDGQRFLTIVPAGGESAPAQPLTVVLNWTAGLKP